MERRIRDRPFPRHGVRRNIRERPLDGWRFWRVLLATPDFAPLNPGYLLCSSLHI
jgi:hypothetical protein